MVSGVPTVISHARYIAVMIVTVEMEDAMAVFQDSGEITAIYLVQTTVSSIAISTMVRSFRHMYYHRSVSFDFRKRKADGIFMEI